MRVALTLEQCWHRVPGGTAVAAIGMGRALRQRPDVDVVGVAARHSEPPPKEWLPPIHTVGMPLPREVLYESWHYLRAPKVQRATGPVDVVHATSFAIPPRSAPLVVTVHDLAFRHYPEHATAHGLRFFKRGLALTANQADLVVCPSYATKRDCTAAGIDGARVHVVPFGIDVTPATPDEIARVRAEYGLARDYVMWSGTIEPRKNLRGLTEAWRRIDTDLDLVLVGPTGWNEDLQAMVGAAPARVKTLGFVGRRELEALYAGARCFCWPSLLEGFGFPVLEAMAQGTPVVTSTGTSTEEVAGDAAVLVDPHDSSAIANGVRSVLEDPDLHDKLSEAGRTRARQFSWVRTAESLIAAYAEVAT